MPRWVVCGLLVFGAAMGGARAQFAPIEAVEVQSFSGQFTVRAQRSVRPPPGLGNLTTNRALVRIDPALLAVSCERVKQALANELCTAGSWKGKIHMNLRPATAGGEPITITAQRFNNAWQYRVDLPDLVRRERFVRAMVQVLLMERANRTAGTRTAELPEWLGEGLAQQLLAANELELVLSRPRPNSKGLLIASSVVSARREDPLRDAHKVLAGRQPLTFEELSWPPADQGIGEADELYRCSAQLFLRELSRLKNGRACLEAMLAELPQRYNWQMSFFDAFRPYFQRPIDVEKWWALRAARFTGRELAKTWPPPESWQKLYAAVHPAAQVRPQTNDLPLRAEVALQSVVRGWDTAWQMEALNATLRELGLIRPHLTAEFGALADDYRQALQTYLPKMPQALAAYRSGKKPRLGLPVAEVLRELDDLEARLAWVRPASLRTATAPAAGPVQSAAEPASP